VLLTYLHIAFIVIILVVVVVVVVVVAALLEPYDAGLYSRAG
jgi:hypothetical protein